MRRIAAAILGALVLAPIGGGLFQALATAVDRTAHTPPGALVMAGDALLHVHCSGPADGPPVFLETGMGVVSDAWSHVQDDLAQDHRVCRYDRAGMGHSAPFDGPKDAGAAADRLAALAIAVGIQDPMILAGHSYGGLIARIFAARYPDRVAGLVLVDSAHEEMGQRLPSAGRTMVNDILGAFGTLSLLNRFGVTRIVGAPAPWIAGLEGEERANARAVYASVSHMRAAAREAAAWQAGISTGLAQGIDSLGRMPLTVMVADAYPDGLVEPWIGLQRELAALSSRSQTVIVSGADHYGIVQRSEHASLVAQEIRTLSQAIDR